MSIGRLETFGLLVPVLICAAILAGCGGSSEGGTGVSRNDSASSIESGHPLTKADFIKRADAICKRTDKTQEESLKTHSTSNATEAQIEDLIRRYGFPPIHTELKELRELNPPPQDRVEVDAIIEESEAALIKAEANPSSVISSTGPFAPIEQRAGKYGFKACNSPV